MSTLLIIGVVLIIIAIVAYALGARGVAGMSADLGKFMIIAAVVIFLILVVIGVLQNHPISL